MESQPLQSSKKLATDLSVQLFKIAQQLFFQNLCDSFRETTLGGGKLVVENDIQQRTVHLETAVVVDEAQFPEAVHEETDPRAGRADHLGQSFLTDLGDHGFRNAFLAEMRQ